MHFPTLSPSKAKGSALLLLAGLAIATILFQRRLISQLSGENVSLREDTGRLTELARENAALSNRLARANTPQFRPNEQLHELLRLRGEVGVLRRQLEEIQSLTNAQSAAWPQTNSAASSASQEMAWRAVLLAEYIRLKTVLDKLEAEAPAPGSAAHALLLSREDDLLKSLLEQLASAEGRLATLQKGHDPEDPEVTVIRRQMEDLSTQIQTRSEGVLSGMKARLLSKLQLLLDEGQQKGAGGLAEDSR